MSQNKLIPGLEIILDDDDDDEAPGTPDEVVSLVDDDEDVKVPEDAPSPGKDEGTMSNFMGLLLLKIFNVLFFSELFEEEDDDVILNEVAPIKIVVDDDDDDPMDQENGDSSQPIVIKKEKKPAFDDGFVDVGEIITLNESEPIKIKSEPVDGGMFKFLYVPNIY